MTLFKVLTSKDGEGGGSQSSSSSSPPEAIQLHSNRVIDFLHGTTVNLNPNSKNSGGEKNNANQPAGVVGGGVAAAVDAIKKSVPVRLRETAYALAVEVAAADLDVRQEELRFLELLRDKLEISKLVVSAIERGARARHRKL